MVRLVRDARGLMSPIRFIWRSRSVRLVSEVSGVMSLIWLTLRLISQVRAKLYTTEVRYSFIVCTQRG